MNWYQRLMAAIAAYKAKGSKPSITKAELRVKKGNGFRSISFKPSIVRPDNDDAQYKVKWFFNGKVIYRGLRKRNFPYEWQGHKLEFKMYKGSKLIQTVEHTI